MIGEGALEIFRTAKRTLLNENALIVPKRAHIYCQLIESRFLTNGNLFRSIKIRDGDRTNVFDHRDEINNCPGLCAQLNDMQLNSLSLNEFKLISDVKIAFIIDFENPPNNNLDVNEISFKILNRPNKFSNVCIAVWWDLDMDQEGEIVLSCAPYWARNDVIYEKLFDTNPIDDVSVLYKSEEQFQDQRNLEKELKDLNHNFLQNYLKFLNQSNGQFPPHIEQKFEKLRLSCQWRDHWMQAVYFLPKDSFKNPIIEEQILEIQAFRNDYQFWFNYLTPSKIKNINEQNIQPCCLCGYHRTYSRNQIRQINDQQTIHQLTTSFSDVYKKFKDSNDHHSNGQMNQASSMDFFIDLKPTKRLKTDDNCNVFICGGMGIISLLVITLAPESTIFLHNPTKACPFYKEIIYKERLEDKFLGATNLLTLETKIDILIKDPCINLDKLPWLDVHEFLSAYRSLLGRNIPIVLPNKINFKVMPVCFDHLWKIRYVIKKIDGLDLMPFHQMVDKALEIESRKIEMYSLSEYDGVALGLPQILTTINVANMDTYKGETNLNFDFNCAEIRKRFTDLYGLNSEETNRSIFDQQLDKVLPFRRSLTNIAFVIWPEYSKLVNTGPTSVKINYSTKINWNKLFKQVVYFMPEFNRDYLGEVDHLKIGFQLNYDFTGSKNLFKFGHTFRFK